MMESRTMADFCYKNALEYITKEGDIINTRNAITKSEIDLTSIAFVDTPLVTLRKTAWKKALLEMEWFLSGNCKCPEELLDWWAGQLNDYKELVAGYGHQFRMSGLNVRKYFDQIEFIKAGLINSPNSRRLLLTSWNPYDMAHITEINDNPNTPTCCHNTMTQFFVREGELHMKTYQRSADMLLGVPHNWIQSWAMLMWFAYHANLKVGTMYWSFGDAHIYQEESHLQVVEEICSYEFSASLGLVSLQYTPTSEEFLAKDFKLVGEIPKPCTTIRPKLL